jgi:hypothetical protein
LVPSKCGNLKVVRLYVHVDISEYVGVISIDILLLDLFGDGAELLFLGWLLRKLFPYVSGWRLIPRKLIKGL